MEKNTHTSDYLIIIKTHVACAILILHTFGFYCFLFCTQVHLTVFLYIPTKIPTLSPYLQILSLLLARPNAETPVPSFPPPPVRLTCSLTPQATSGKCPRHLQPMCALMPVPGGPPLLVGPSMTHQNANDNPCLRHRLPLGPVLASHTQPEPKYAHRPVSHFDYSSACWRIPMPKPPPASHWCHYLPLNIQFA